jgi:hypothetical protein
MAYLTRAVLAFGLMLAWTALARADPILTPIFVAAIAAATGLAATSAVVTISAAILTAITVAAIGFGLTMLLTKKPKVPQAEDGALTVQQPLPFRNLAYGTVRHSGAFMLHEEIAGRLVKVQAVFGHRIKEWVGIYLNDDPVTLTAIGTPDYTGALNGYVNTGEDGRYKNQVIKIDTRLGLDTETPYKSIVDLVNVGSSGIGIVWSNNHRGDGIASIAMLAASVKQADFSTSYPYGAPQLSAVANTALLFDPRDVTQSYLSPSTWKFSSNPVLAWLDFMCFSRFGYQRDYATTILPIVDLINRAADDCDEFVPMKSGGTQPRYRLGFFMSAEQDRKIALQAILASCDGWMCQRGDGTIIMEVGKYREPLCILTDADIIGYSLQSDAPSSQRINQSTARYTSPENHYITVETFSVIDAADQAIRPGPPRVSILDLSAVQNIGQASRLHKREVIRQRARVRGTLTVKWSGMDACYGRRIRVQSNTIPLLNNAVIENIKSVQSASTQTCEISFIRVGAEIDEYNAAVDESPPAKIPQKPRTFVLEPPENIDAVAVQMLDANSNTYVSIHVSWDDPYDGVVNHPVQAFAVRWRVIGAPSWNQTDYDSLTPSAGQFEVETGLVPPEQNIEVQVASKGVTALSQWSAPSVEVDTHVASVAPGEPTNLMATGAVGIVNLSARFPNSPNVASIRFYRSIVGGGFGLATAIGTDVYGAANATGAYAHTVTAGTYDFYVVAKNAAGVASTDAGPVTATAT